MFKFLHHHHDDHDDAAADDDAKQYLGFSPKTAELMIVEIYASYISCFTIKYLLTLYCTMMTFTPMRKWPFLNVVGKLEHAGNHDVFLVYPMTICTMAATLKLSSVHTFN